MSVAGATVIGAIRVYQATVRPLTACSCRFYPRCSDYGIEAVRRHGVWRGGLMAGARVLRCNPWVLGGEDPVPAAGQRAETTG